MVACLHVGKCRQNLTFFGRGGAAAAAAAAATVEGIEPIYCKKPPKIFPQATRLLFIVKSSQKFFFIFYTVDSPEPQKVLTAKRARGAFKAPSATHTATRSLIRLNTFESLDCEAGPHRCTLYVVRQPLRSSDHWR